MRNLTDFDKKRLLMDHYAEKSLRPVVICSGFLVLLIASALFLRSWPLLAIKPWHHLLFSFRWYPSRGEFGYLGFIAGSLWVTAIACLIAIPVCFLSAIYLAEYAHRRIREWVNPFIDILAGIPSVVYGMWGVLVIVPFVSRRLAPIFGVSSSGYSILPREWF